MRACPFAFVFCFAWTAVEAAPAAAQRASDPVYASIERFADAAARIEQTFCDTNLAVISQGAIDGINAMPARSGQPALHMNRPGLNDLANIYSELINNGADIHALEDAAINGMVHAYDERGSWQASLVAQRPRNGAIGVQLDGSGPLATVIDAFADAPAARAGIQRGDRLIAIDGDILQGLRLPQVVQRLQGAIGSTIEVTVERGGAPITVSMQRAAIIARSVDARVIDNVGIIAIHALPERTGRDVRDALRSMRRQQLSGYIIDLRDNAGGLLDQTIDVLDQFIDRGGALNVRGFGACHAHEVQRYNVRGGDETNGAHLIVLINANTASGGEAIAATLRERRGAMIVGQSSAGANDVATVIPMQGGRDGFLRLTTGILTTPSGISWHGAGLLPDVQAEPRSADSDPTLDRALALLRPQSPAP
jgi:carboxyl-terminal processing protease